MSTKTLLSIVLGITAVSCFSASSAQALSFTAGLEEFTGDNAAGKITLEDWVGGGVKFTAEITAPTINGDISGLWFGLKDTSLLSSLHISNLMTNTGDNSFKYIYNSDSNATSCLSSGQNNLNGGTDKTFCESGLTNGLISFGKAGSSGGLVQTVSFILSSKTNPLTITNFNEAFGLRYQSTGGSEGSSKLRYYYPGYKGTTSDSFELPAGQTPPPGAVPVGNTQAPNEPAIVESPGKGKGKGKK